MGLGRSGDSRGWTQTDAFWRESLLDLLGVGCGLEDTEKSLWVAAVEGPPGHP
jgi:hypothetical protein